MMKPFKIKTLGCKVNQYETQVIREGLLSAGYQEAKSHQKASLCIVNTCTVTAKADGECREVIRRYIRENPDAQIVITGCYVEKDSDAIKAIDERVRIVSNKDKSAIVDILTASPKRQSASSGISYFEGHNRVFIKVQDGCDNFCSYCKVPYVRGGSRSRDPQEILDEAERLIKNGYKELVLTGICLGDFGKELDNGITLTWVIQKISDIKGDFRIRLSSIELPDVSNSLIAEMSGSLKLCRHFHIPLQSGDDEILNQMNRQYTSSEFISRVEYIRSQIPDVAITTDIIIGFPGENEQNFKNTLGTIRKVKPSRAHIFTYSPRQGTKAFERGDNVHPKVKAERFKRLKELTDRFADDSKQQSQNKKQRVLVENVRDRKTGCLTGYTDSYVKVLIDGSDELIGKLIYPGLFTSQ